jgi:hypothetical protein
MSYSVDIYDESDTLPEELEEEYQTVLDDYRKVLVVTHNRKITLTEVDGGEPEDANFYRDYSWIKKALLDAYQAGYDDCATLTQV